MKSAPVIAIIPARYNSSRLPGKPLISLYGKPMIQRVYERAQQIPGVDKVIVATDDERIFAAVQQFGGNAAMTPENIATGSERVGFVARDMNAEIVINLQGDEPLADSKAIGKLVTAMRDNPAISIGTLGFPLISEKEWRDPSVVKVIVDEEMNAIYFSRAPIPHSRDGQFQPLPNLFRHVGVYVFRKSFLLKYLSWPESCLEAVEKLEQLRILEKNYPVKVMQSEQFSPGVDTPEDVKYVEKIIKERGK